MEELKEKLDRIIQLIEKIVETLNCGGAGKEYTDTSPFYYIERVDNTCDAENTESP